MLHKKRAPRSSRSVLLRALVTFSLLAILLSIVGTASIRDALSQIQPQYIALALPLVILAWFLSGCALWVLFRPFLHTRFSISSFWSPYVTSTFVALWLPGRVGDFSIAWLLRNNSAIALTASLVLVDKLLSIVAIVVCAVLACYYYVGFAAGVAATASGVAILVGTVHILTNRPATAAALRASPSRLRRVLAQLARGIRQALSKPARSVVAYNLLLKLLRVVVVGLLMVTLVHAFGDSVSFALATVGAAVAQLLALVPISIQGLGIQELAYLYIMQLEGANPAAVLMASVTSRIVSIAAVSALFVMAGRLSKG